MSSPPMVAPSACEIGLAAQIVSAFRSGRAATPPNTWLPTTRPQAEAIAARASSALGPVAAYKLGGTIPAVRAALGLDAAFAGPLPMGRVFASGARLPTGHWRAAGVECEYAFCLAQDLPSQSTLALCAHDLPHIIHSVHPALEIPASRFPSLGAYGGLALIADLGAAGGLVVGEGEPLGSPARFFQAPVELRIGQAAPATGSGAVIDGGPCGALLRFLNTALRQGLGLRKGQFIATGACTGYVPAGPGAPITARFSALRSAVSCHFAEEA